jgi:hypothetical protein
MALQRANAVMGGPALFADKPEHQVALLRAAWPAAVGAELARRTEVVALEGKTLRVRVPDGRWRKTLHGMSRDIIVRLRETTGPLAPARLGFMEMRPDTPAPEPPPAEATPPPAPAETGDHALPESVAAAAGSIPDPELRARFLASARLYLARRSRT